MIEATIESKFKTQINAVCTTYTVDVIGWYDTEATGTVAKDQPPFIRLTTPPGSASAQIKDNRYDVNFNVEILSVVEADPDKKQIVYWAGQVQDLFQSLKNDQTTMASSSYSEAGVYTINGIELTGGDLGYDSESKCWFVNIPLTIHYCKL
jgi:hypothetical protein